jgi:hypothetical protein
MQYKRNYEVTEIYRSYQKCFMVIEARTYNSSSSNPEEHRHSMQIPINDDRIINIGDIIVVSLNKKEDEGVDASGFSVE